MVRDFVPISLLTTGHYMLVAHPSVAVKSARDLIVLAKVRPGQLNYASAGNGNARWFGFSAGNSGTPMGIQRDGEYLRGEVLEHYGGWLRWLRPPTMAT